MFYVPKALLAAAAAPLLLVSPAFGQNAEQPGRYALSGPRYADFADLVLAAPMIVDAVIASVVRIKGEEAAGVAPGMMRFYVNAEVQTLIRGSSGIPKKVGYLVDVPVDSLGKTPKLKHLRVLLFARPVANRPDQIQLVAPDAQRPWSPAADALARRIARDAVAADAPPVITGVGNAFHVPGSLPGEGETQIFLATADGSPVSLSILSRPGEQKRWAVALSEIVDNAAAPPRPDTLLWYRLACALPPELPQSSLDTADPASASQARADYRFVLRSLGPCDRSHSY
ncbi:hypothetical protein DFR49_1828 [Hephaestia caeni]|uniref:Uncharacterized protein n=1 Tax=Hephaestia caeni TaxID=645617 RepID=A0A397PBX4_9SPHN|nr:hypothetical protein [Hephaestia caeni]RIA43604.1 hypothetical protein DFR49_1828 [Hephaestia caeni]